MVSVGSRGISGGATRRASCAKSPMAEAARLKLGVAYSMKILNVLVQITPPNLHIREARLCIWQIVPQPVSARYPVQQPHFSVIYGSLNRGWRPSTHHWHPPHEKA